MVCSYPERFAQAALGHNSKAVHRDYARHAEVTLPSLDDYERIASKRRIIEVGFQSVATTQKPAAAPIDPAWVNSSCATCKDVGRWDRVEMSRPYQLARHPRTVA